MDGKELWRRLDRLTSTVNSVSEQLDQLRFAAAELNLPDKDLPQCPECGPVHLPKGVTIAEHLHNVHGIDE